MADELNIPTHRWYERRNNISLANADFSKQWIYDSGIQKIDRWINSQPWGNPIPGLFSGTAIGIWLDPSDVANLTWRRNLLTYSEQFDNSAWTKTRTTISANAITAPDGTSTADKLVEDTSTNDHWVGLSPDDVAGASYTASVFAKSGERGFVALSWQFENPTFFNLTTGAIGTQNPNYTASIAPLSDGWFRCSIRRTAVSTSDFLKISVRNADGVASYTGDGTSGIYIWGAQFEAGSLTDYQRISDVNTEVIERFPTATMYQDAAGTTPVTTPGQPVGLRLDKSKGLVLGAELVANGTFDSGATGWSVTQTGGTATLTASSGVATLANPAASIYATAYQSFTTVVGRAYKVTGQLISASGTALNALRKSDSPGGGTNDVTIYGGSGALVPGTGTGYFIATATTSFVLVQVNGASNTISFDNISVRELAGNHATQSVLASRPVYGIEPAGGRRNLLTFSEQMETAAWVRTSLTATANTFAAPDGTTTADLMTGLNGWFAGEAVGFGAANQQLTGSIWVYPPAGVTSVTIRIDRSGIAQGNQTVKTVTPGVWTRITHTATLDFATAAPALRLDLTGGASLTVWGAQLELGSTATPYQRVTTAFDVTEAGVQSCHYVQYDGSDDGMVTNSIDFTATDKMSVFAGVRKLSDAATGVIAEYSANSGSNAGTWGLFSGGYGAGAAAYAANLNGSQRTSFDATTFTAPISNVLTLTFDIAAAARAEEIGMRVNGVVPTLTGGGNSNAGTGNFSAQPLYIGRKAGTSAPFSGRDYGIVVVGKTTTADEITSTERWLSGKTGFYAPIITGVPTIGVS